MKYNEKKPPREFEVGVQRVTLRGLMSLSRSLREHYCPLCKGRRLEGVFIYDRPPAGETLFELGAGINYRREIWRCVRCGHFISAHEMDLSNLYQQEYMKATYGKQMRKRFEEIVALPAKESDNAGRVARVDAFAKGRTVLDVGSGLCVFLYAMKKAGWRGTALDPDEAVCRHAREVVGIKAVCGDFMKAERLGKYDLVTFNKVLEHVQDPVVMLAKAQECLRPQGLVYVEVPDGELAVREGQSREEFFIEHWHVFSAVSLAILVQGAGFVVLSLGRLVEPSGKYTLWAFGSRRSDTIDLTETDVKL